MALTNIMFENGIFYCCEVGRIDETDAQQWADLVAQYASLWHLPIIALIDAREATYLTASARSIFARASAIPNLHKAAIVTQDFQVSQNAHLIAMMSVVKHTHIFESLDEAWHFAVHHANLLQACSGVAV